MNKAEEDLEAILDLLAEWQREYCRGCDVSVWIGSGGGGIAYDFDGTCSHYEVSKNYEPAGGRRTGSGK